jgi:hypothetical protein
MTDSSAIGEMALSTEAPGPEDLELRLEQHRVELTA